MEVPYGKSQQAWNIWELISGRKLKGEPRVRPLYYSRLTSKISIQREGDPSWPPTSEGELSFRYDLMTANSLDDNSVPGQAQRAAYNKAYARFIDQLGPRSELGTTLAETRSSLTMIAKRAAQIGDAWLALKKGEFKKFLRTLDVDPKRKHRDWKRSKPKEAGGLWVEYWFGWAPLIGDIFASVEVAVSPYPFAPIKATATVPWTWSKFTGNANDHWQYYASGTARVRISADIRISNPNLYLANQLGALNPAAIAWNLLPWSWLVGWFGNISQVLTSLTDFVGLELKDAQIMRITKGEGNGWYYYAYSPYRRKTSFLWHGVQMRRTVGGITPPSVRFALPPGLSWTRGATAIGLLVQKLKT